MQNTINKPVFVLGSSRSGTSVPTWCLHQHLNIFTVDESTGTGEMALALGVAVRQN
jgi:UDP-N-acetylmuramoylalanine-D-glutamate ligase